MVCLQEGGASGGRARGGVFGEAAISAKLNPAAEVPVLGAIAAYVTGDLAPLPQRRGVARWVRAGIRFRLGAPDGHSFPHLFLPPLA